MKISVITTVLNEEKTIAALLTALTKQTRKPDEIVLVDGGSTDQTLAVIERLKTGLTAAQKKSLKVWQKPGNRSVGRNYAINKATHDWIAITDAGCIPHQNWLAALEKKALSVRAQQGDHTLVVAGYYDAKTSSPFETAVVPYFLVMPDRIKSDDFLPATRSMLIHRSVWATVGRFNEALSDNEDYDLAKRLQKSETQRKQRLLYFTARAKVQWLPPTTLPQFAHTIFRFARGDAQASIWRPKVGLLFARYVIGLLVVGLSFGRLPIHLWLSLCLLALLVYSAWSITKNFRYASQGWPWLPVLQLTADGAVMTGTLVGLFRSLQLKPKRV